MELRLGMLQNMGCPGMSVGCKGSPGVWLGVETEHEFWIHIPFDSKVRWPPPE